MSLPERLIHAFPRLARSSVAAETSEPTPAYNCIAWALGFDDRWMWPADGYFWPAQVPREATLEAFSAAFESFGFVATNDHEVEPDVEKLVLYAIQREPTHAARQVPDGTWTSKCGKDVDIVHALEDLAGDCYGEPIAVFARPRVEDDVRESAS